MKQELVVDRGSRYPCSIYHQILLPGACGRSGQSVSMFDLPPDSASWAIPLSQNIK